METEQQLAPPLLSVEEARAMNARIFEHFAALVALLAPMTPEERTRFDDELAVGQRSIETMGRLYGSCREGSLGASEETDLREAEAAVAAALAAVQEVTRPSS